MDGLAHDIGQWAALGGVAFAIHRMANSWAAAVEERARLDERVKALIERIEKLERTP